MKNKAIVSSLLLLLTAAIWGAAFVAQSVGTEYVGPLTFNAVRMLLGAVAILPVSVFFSRRRAASGEDNGASPRPQRAALIKSGLICGGALFVASTLQQYGIMHTTVGKSGFITSLYILIVPILGLFFKRKIHPVVWIGVAVAVVGMFLLCMSESLTLSKGDLLVLACAVGFSVQIMAVSHFSPMVDGVKLSLAQLAVSGSLAFIGMFIFERPELGAILDAWQSILYAGVCSCGVAYTLQIIAQRNINPTVASLLMSLESVFAVLAGWVLLGETLTSRELIGAALMLIAVFLAQTPDYFSSALSKFRTGQKRG